jgi:hypothetical protein
MAFGMASQRRRRPQPYNRFRVKSLLLVVLGTIRVADGNPLYGRGGTSAGSLPLDRSGGVPGSGGATVSDGDSADDQTKNPQNSLNRFCGFCAFFVSFEVALSLEGQVDRRDAHDGSDGGTRMHRVRGMERALPGVP